MNTKVAGQAHEPIGFVATIGPEPGKRLRREMRLRKIIFLLGHRSVPADGRLVEIDENLFCLEIFLESPGPELAAEAGLFVAAPGRLDIGRLHVIDPHDAGAQRLHDSKRLINIARPDRRSKAVRRIVCDSNRIGFGVERNYGCDRAENLLPRDARGVLHVVKNGGLDVVAFAELPGVTAADGHLRFLLAELEIGVYAFILLFADERAHFGIAFEWRAQFDTPGLLGHGLDEFRIDFPFDEDAAPGRTYFSLIDEHAEERSVDGGFPIGVGKENIGRFAAKLEGDALERIGGAFNDDFADSGAAGEGDLVDTGVSDECGARDFSEAIDNV